MYVMPRLFGIIITENISPQSLQLVDRKYEGRVLNVTPWKNPPLATTNPVKARTLPAPPVVDWAHLIAIWLSITCRTKVNPERHFVHVLSSVQVVQPLGQVTRTGHYPAKSPPSRQEVHFRGPAPEQVAQLLSQAVQRLKVPKYPSLHRQVWDAAL